MKKSVTVSLTIASVLIVGILLVIITANNAIPGDALYSVDRATERINLSLKKSFNKLAYGSYNLSLASERIAEINALKLQSVSAQGPIAKVAAASINEEKLKLYLPALLSDIEENLTNAQSVLTQIPELEQQKLSLEIADNTSRYGELILSVTKDLSEETIKQFRDVITKIEDVDTNAIDLLAGSEDTSPGEETKHETEVSATLEAKLQTKLLKLRELERIYETIYEANKSTLPTADVTKLAAQFDDIKSDLTTAETQLGSQAFKAVADILDRTADKLDSVRSLLNVDDGIENETEKPEPSETPEAEDDNKTPTPTTKTTITTTPKVSKTPEPSETPEPTEKPEPSETPEASGKDDGEVEGVQTQPTSFLDLLRNRLRF